MTGIYLETGHKNTPEHVFISTLMKRLGFSAGVHYEIVNVGGKDNLVNAANSMLARQLQGDKNLIIFDADSAANGGGYQMRKAIIAATLASLNIDADVFLFPDNGSDGDFETLLERIARKDLHQLFFDCFGDFECCVQPRYLAPNRKGKLHTYVNAQPWLSTAERNGLGKGQWLFENDNLWDLQSAALEPLKAFIIENIGVINKQA
ncbi:MAG: hypothetical protein NC418_01370 [Muribaculaceae bacterium]|nr:hypothetical protein [Muribaculaceae bacterium]